MNEEMRSAALATAAGMLMRDDQLVRSLVVTIARLESLREEANGRLVLAVEAAYPDLDAENLAVIVDTIEAYAVAHMDMATEDILAVGRRADA